MSEAEDRHVQTDESTLELVRQPLTDLEFQRLADMPPEVEWFANVDNSTPSGFTSGM